MKNPDDRATQMSASILSRPGRQDGRLAARAAPGGAWEVETIAPEAATKRRLEKLLGGPDTPEFLFTASHGMGFPADDPKQLPFQGALLCQDWPGPYGGFGPISRDHYFGAEDVADGASPAGMIAFMFACYGGGTPRYDDFSKQAFRARAAIAPRAFTAALPMRLLGHPRGGALAVIGHIERAWGYSILDNGVDQIEAFRSALHRLKYGQPVGAALEFFNERYAELSTSLSDELEEIKFGKIPDEYALAGLWTANNDARSFVVIGDPAVRVAVPADAAAPEPRPALSLGETVVLSPPLPPSPATAANEGSPSVLSVAAATEQRFRDRATGGSPTVSFAPGAARAFQANPPARVRKRLARLGLPPAEIDALLARGQPSFAVLGPGAAPSAAQLGLERIFSRNNLIGVEFLTAAVAAARSVGRVLIRRPMARCSGTKRALSRPACS